MMAKLADAFDVVIGYSDHTTGIDVALASVALGAKVQENICRQMGRWMVLTITFRLSLSSSQLTASAMRNYGHLNIRDLVSLPKSLRLHKSKTEFVFLPIT